MEAIFDSKDIQGSKEEREKGNDREKRILLVMEVNREAVLMLRCDSYLKYLMDIIIQYLYSSFLKGP